MKTHSYSLVLSAALASTMLVTGCGGARVEGNPSVGYVGRDLTALDGKERAKMVKAIAPLTGDAAEPLPGQGPIMVVDLRGGVTAVVSNVVTGSSTSAAVVTRIASDGRVDWQWQLPLPKGWQLAGQKFHQPTQAPTKLLELQLTGPGKTAKVFVAAERRPLVVRVADAQGGLLLNHAWKDLPGLVAGRGSLRSSDPVSNSVN